MSRYMVRVETNAHRHGSAFLTMYYAARAYDWDFTCGAESAREFLTRRDADQLVADLLAHDSRVLDADVVELV